jgi:hypothetical protein
MYRQLGQGDTLPDELLNMVLTEVKTRLTAALDQRITPKAAYNRVGAPDLTVTAPDENWNQPLSLLERSARVLRKSLTDVYFQRRLSARQSAFRARKMDWTLLPKKACMPVTT